MSHHQNAGKNHKGVYNIVQNYGKVSSIWVFQL